MRWNVQTPISPVNDTVIKAGEIPEGWKDKPAKLAQKDRDARWTVKYSKAKQPTETPTSTATRQHDIAIPMFGYKNHAGIDRAHGFIGGVRLLMTALNSEML